MPFISVASTIYNSSGHLSQFVDRLAKELEKFDGEKEIVLVNDGSPDNSLFIVNELCNKYTYLKVYNLSKNYGHHTAMFAAIEKCQGDFIFAIDSDLEEPPELLTFFYTTLNNENADVVYGIQNERKGGFIKKRLGGLFYLLFNLLSDTKIPKNMLMARLMTKRYVNALKLYREKSLFLGAVFADVGFKQIPYFVEKNSRKESNYSFRARLQLAIQGATSFSYKPLLVIFYTGFFIWLISTMYLIFIIYEKICNGTAIGWASLIASVWFLGGLNILFLGIIGIYLSVIFTEIKSRPTILEEISSKSK